MSLKGIEYLRRKMVSHQSSANERYNHYSMNSFNNQIGITIPPQIREQFKISLGWTTKGVDSLADRLVFREFDNDQYQVMDIFRQNNPDIFFDSVVLSSLIGSCCFVYISSGQNDEVRLQVIESSNATGIIDPINGLLTEGYAVLARDDNKQPILEAYFEPNATHFIEKGKAPYSVENPTGIPLLVPVIHRPDAVRPFGRSRVTNSGMRLQKLAQDTLEKMMIASEFYSWPQKYIVGLDPDAEPIEKLKATISSFLTISANENGDKPNVGQFNAASMSPLVDQFKMLASCFAGEMGLTLDDLGFPSDNPSSVEAIKASHENLRLAGRKAQRSLGSGLQNVAYVAACLRDDYPYFRDEFVKTTVKWEPLFEADANMMTLIGDGVLKLNQALPGYITASAIRDLTGIVGDMNAKPVVEQQLPPQPSLEAEDKQKNRIISTYEITSLLSNYQKGVLSKENAISLLISTGISPSEAEAMLDRTKVLEQVDE